MVQGDRTSRDALVVRSRYSMPFFGVGPPPPPCALAVHIGRFTALAIGQGDRTSRDALITRSLCAHSTRCSSSASDRRRRCALAVHIGRLFRSCHRAGRSYKSRCARCALMVLDALLWRRTAAAVCSRRPHRTFVPPLSPWCRAIVQDETRPLCAHGARCPSLASDRRRCVLSLST
jgi:hypothetical protein